MKKQNTNAASSKVDSTRNASWFLSASGKAQQSSFIRKADKLASSVNESRQIPASIVKEPFTV